MWVLTWLGWTCRKSLESSLAQLNTEHCEVLVCAACIGRDMSANACVSSQNELVRSRLRHEELESELVRYKLLYVIGSGENSRYADARCRYAEAMHQSEDAMSSHRISLVSKRGSNSTNN